MKRICTLLLLLPFFSPAQKKQADLIVLNAKIYTVDAAFSVAEAMAISNGRIEDVGTSAKIRAAYTAKKTLDAKKAIIYPGFIDAHAHFYRYGLGLQTADLVGTTSWEAILERLQAFATKN